MKNLIQKNLSILSFVPVVLSAFAIITLAVPALAVTVIGNDTTQRTQVDTASNFIVIDTNNSASASGVIQSFGYYASNMNPFRFILVDNSNVVQYVSPQITPTAVGVNTYTPVSPVPVQSGDNLGVYFSSTGTIPFEFTGATSSWTTAGSGMPTVGTTLTYAGSGARIYSLVGSGMTTMTPVLTSVNVNPTTENLNVGGTQQLTVNPLDQNNMSFAGATIGYVSSNPSVATVSSSGLVTGVSAGMSTITVTATSGSTNVTVTSNVTISNGNNNGGGGGNEGNGGNDEMNGQQNENENEPSDMNEQQNQENNNSIAGEVSSQVGNSDTSKNIQQPTMSDNNSMRMSDNSNKSGNQQKINIKTDN